MKRPRLTLQAKYVTFITLIVSCTSIALSAYYYNAAEAREIAELKAKGRSVTLNLAHNSESGVLLSDTGHLSLLVKLLAEDPDVAGAEIRSKDGRALVRMATDLGSIDPSSNSLAEHVEETSEPLGMTMNQYRLRETGIQLLEFSIPITTRRLARDREEIGLMFEADDSADNQGEKVQIGTAKVVFSSARASRELHRIQQNIIGIAATVALVGILVTIPLVRITVRPIRQLAEGTKKIAAGDLSQRVVATTRDEIGELTDCFNQMAVDLEKYHTELKDYSRTLEEKVSERTHELKRANEELELANTELRKTQAQLIQAGKLAAMGQFGAGVAHELNQPLTGIMGYTQLLLSIIPEHSPLRPQLLQIDKQASRMREITQTMWNLARQSKFEYGFLDIRQPIQDSLVLINEQFRQHQIEIITEIEQHLPRVYGDANQLHQVVLNFLT
ncbi:MAG: HAMP domain-containing protein, partial [Candidatus Hydrogenedentota bacterium]